MKKKPIKREVTRVAVVRQSVLFEGCGKRHIELQSDHGITLNID